MGRGPGLLPVAERDRERGSLTAGPSLRPRPTPGDLNRDPFIVFWELTRACALTCRHCRAEARPQRHPLELSTAECHRVIEQLASFDRPPILILSGGDPFMRRDLFEVIGRARQVGLTVAVAPSATALVTEERLGKLVELGVSSISLSLDGAGGVTHDGFRGFAGTFERTLAIAGHARSLGLPFQVNTTVARPTVEELPGMAPLVAEMGASTWDLFFLVPTGRASARDLLSAEEHERVFEWALANAGSWPFRVKTTLGQHFRRLFILKRLQADSGEAIGPEVKHELARAWPGPATNDGKGVLFISHTGVVFPSGFLPLGCGDVRHASVVEIYRESLLFRALRDTRSLKGRCGACPFNEVCGGSRARAYAVTGDAFAEEPACAYVPPRPAPLEERTGSLGGR